jgi:hypothetical protein
MKAAMMEKRMITPNEKKRRETKKLNRGRRMWKGEEVIRTFRRIYSPAPIGRSRASPQRCRSICPDLELLNREDG